MRAQAAVESLIVFAFLVITTLGVVFYANISAQQSGQVGAATDLAQICGLVAQSIDSAAFAAGGIANFFLPASIGGRPYTLTIFSGSVRGSLPDRTCEAEYHTLVLGVPMNLTTGTTHRAVNNNGVNVTVT